MGTNAPTRAETEKLLDEALEVAGEARADLENFESVLRISTEKELNDKDGNPVKVLVADANFDGFFSMFNRFGNPVEYLAPDSEEMATYLEALTTGDIDWLENNPYEYNERGYRIHTGKMAVYKNAMSNIKLTKENLPLIGQAALTALDNHVTGFFYLNRVSALTGLLGQAKRDFTTAKANDITSL